MLDVQWRAGVGYGDFVTGLGYAHTISLKCQVPVNINFHWNHSKDFQFSPSDPETIVSRCDYVYGVMKKSPLVTYSHTFNSKPPYRFINQFDEFNPLHGLWYTELKCNESKNVVLWTSRKNINFPGKDKDPAFRHWNKIEDKLRSLGFSVIEVTYRTPVQEKIDLIRDCAFGIGYDGLAHQLFKFMWKPVIVICGRIGLNKLLIPQAALEHSPEKFLENDLEVYLGISRSNIERLKQEHKKYYNSFMNPYEHKLYNTAIG